MLYSTRYYIHVIQSYPHGKLFPGSHRLCLGFITSPGLILLLNHLVLRRKLQADAVHTMALIRRHRESLALENMTQVAAAVGADNLGSDSAEASVLVPGDGAGDAVEIRRPAAARVELVRCLVERRVACSAGVGALLGVVLIKLSSAGGFGALFSENPELRCGRCLAKTSALQKNRRRGKRHTGIQNGAPFLISSLVGIRHGG